MTNSKYMTIKDINAAYFGKNISDFSARLKKQNMSIVDSNNNGIFDSGDSISYKIQKGDTLFKIANKNGIKIKDLRELNKDINPNKIKANDSLWLQKGKIKEKEEKKNYKPLAPMIKFDDEFEMPTAIAKANDNPFNKKLIMIDVGHGEKDPGAVCPFDSSKTEAQINQNAANLLKQKLEEFGYEVHIAKSRGGGVNGRNERLREKRAMNPDYYLSIHTNAGANTANGEEVCYRNDGDKLFANTLAQSMKKDDTFASRNKGNAIHKPKLQVLASKSEKTKSALVEVGFITNEADCEKLYNTETLEKQVLAIATGIQSYDLAENYKNQNMLARNK